MNSKLKRCGPLADPVEVAGMFMRANIVFTFACTLLIVLRAFLTASASERVTKLVVAGVMIAVAFAVSVPMLKAVWMVLRERTESPDLCLFLRAFRSDAASEKLRAWLKAGLG